MKKIICSLAIILALTSCEKDLYEDGIKQSSDIKKTTQEYVSISEVPELIPEIQAYNRAYNYLSSGNYSHPTGRSSEELDLDLENILKVIDTDGKESFSVNIKKAFNEYEDIFFENLHIYEKDGSFTSKILKYNQVDDSEKFDMNTFTGTVEMYDKERNLEGIFEYVNGAQRCEKITVGCYHIWFFSTTGQLWIWNDCGVGSGDSNSNETGQNTTGTGNTFGSNNNNGTAPNPADPTYVDHTTIAPNYLWPESTTQLDKANRIANRVGLDTTMRTWLRAPMNAEITDEIYNFLLPFSMNNLEINNFTKQAIIAIKNGDSVDFQKKIIYSITKPCQKQIVKDIIDSCTPFTNMIYQTFNTDERANIKIQNNNIVDGSPGQTNPFYYGTPASPTIAITLDNNYLDTATDLSIVAVTLHELVHAYLMNLYIKGELVATNSNYKTLFDAYIAFYANKNRQTWETLDTAMHNAMQDYISMMANSLYNYALTKNISGVSADFCFQLAYGTMYGTELFNNLSTINQQTYVNIAATEQDNLQGAKGTPCN